MRVLRKIRSVQGYRKGVAVIRHFVKLYSERCAIFGEASVRELQMARLDEVVPESRRKARAQRGRVTESGAAQQAAQRRRAEVVRPPGSLRDGQAGRRLHLHSVDALSLSSDLARVSPA